MTPHEAVLRPGIDVSRLNQLADELEDEAILEKSAPEGSHSGRQLTVLCLEVRPVVNGAVDGGRDLHSNDRDFGRFPGLKWTNPLV